MSEIVQFPGATSERPLVESYDDDDNLRHAAHFRCLQTRIDDCACMSLFTIDTMEKADDGKNPQLAFAVYHLVEMVLDLKRHYHAAYNGEIEP
jgi:hypothetical protein